MIQLFHRTASLIWQLQKLDLIGVSAEIEAIRQKLLLFARHGGHVLISGERGCGKKWIVYTLYKRQLDLNPARRGVSRSNAGGLGPEFKP